MRPINRGGFVGPHGSPTPGPPYPGSSPKRLVVNGDILSVQIDHQARQTETINSISSVQRFEAPIGPRICRLTVEVMLPEFNTGKDSPIIWEPIDLESIRKRATGQPIYGGRNLDAAVLIKMLDQRQQAYESEQARVKELQEQVQVLRGQRKKRYVEAEMAEMSDDDLYDELT